MLLSAVKCYWSQPFFPTHSSLPSHLTATLLICNPCSSLVTFVFIFLYMFINRVSGECQWYRVPHLGKDARGWQWLYATSKRDVGDPTQPRKLCVMDMVMVGSMRESKIYACIQVRCTVWWATIKELGVHSGLLPGELHKLHSESLKETLSEKVHER